MVVLLLNSFLVVWPSNLLTLRKRKKGQRLIHTPLHRQLKIEQHESHECSESVSGYCSISGTRRGTPTYKGPFHVCSSYFSTHDNMNNDLR